LRHELENSRKQLRAQQDNSGAEQTRLEARIRELQAAKAEVEQQVNRLTETLAEEARHREEAEQRASDIGLQRGELEAELAKNKQAQTQLLYAFEALQKQLHEHQENSRVEQARLDARTKELQAAKAEVEQEVRRLTERVAAETWRREGAEQQAGEIGLRCSELHAELARNNQAQAQLRYELQASQQQLQSQQESFNTEQTWLETRTQQLQSAKVEVEQKVTELTEALTQETRLRKGAEQQAGEISLRRDELETELAKNTQVQAQLRNELEESQNQFQAQRQIYIAEQAKLEARTRELGALTAELAAVRSRIELESLQCRKLAEKVVEIERAKAELATQADAASALAKSQEDSIRCLDSKVRQHQGEVDKLGALLQSEIAQRRREHSQVEALEKQAAELTGQLAEKVAEQQRWHQRESELEQRVRQQKEQLANTAAAATIQQVELNTLKSTVDDLRVIKSTLCAHVRELTAQHDGATRRIHELADQSQAATQTIQAREQELASLRHAILDAARVGSEVSRERLQVECQVVDGWKRLVTTLLQTPLSTAQRGLVGEIIGALDGWRKGRADATNGVEFQVEPPGLHCSEFNCAEVIESALEAVRKNADKNGTKVQTALVGPVPQFAHGSAQHIHQLITMLGRSLPEIGRVENLEVQVSFETKQNGSFGSCLSLLFSSTSSDETLGLRLRSLTESSASLRTVRHGGPELALASAWQLALAMGGTPTIETTTDRKVRVQVLLPLMTAASLSSEIATRQASVESNGKSGQPSDSSGTPIIIGSKNGQ
jgi:chromosome segregation ATPase